MGDIEMVLMVVFVSFYKRRLELADAISCCMSTPSKK